MSVYFAYDGSIHGDWVSHYATRLASSHEEKRLHLLHVCKATPNGVIQQKTDLIRTECQRLDIDLEVHVQQFAGEVFQAVRSAVPAGPGSYLVCGTRSREHKQGLLSGSISERLLRSRHCHVLAIRVFQPGLLGLPRRLLVPVSGHPRGFRAGLPFLKLFARDVSHLHILHVARVSRWRFRILSHASAEKLQQPGWAYCAQVEQHIRDALGLGAGVVDGQVVVSDDVPKELVIYSNKTRSRLIYLGASDRNLTERFFFGNPIEQVLRDATCDVAIYRGLE